MKRFVIAILLLSIYLPAISQDDQRLISIIPQPVSMVTGTGSFALTNSSQIEISSTNADATRVADSLSKEISFATGYDIPVKAVQSFSNTPGIIQLSISNDATIGNEGYKLNVTSESVSIT